MELQILDKTFVPFISAAEIDKEIQRIAKDLHNNFQNEVPVFLVVLNGAFMFAADLLKHYTTPAQVSFVKVASYQGTETTGKVNQLLGLDVDLTNKHVVIVEDIVDTGTTITAIQQVINTQKVKSMQVAALFFKPEAYTQTVEINHVGFRIPNKFIVGYGLDYNKQGRNLPEVYQIK
ncbi:hypoxanthine phosphoribosyltransferase [Flavobacterium sp. CBA20B-1]|uniref:hypoxanthine phosphoribosyltransferase n=1 Tax=unclassified Flavobacterium TaxID=196869 RepID=UPI002225A712|nr:MULTISPECIES: hypoxanthine phosphoribosyltransferase [unclassified Flavobacterium]WCM43305.1 hypoxanthine phosphoribosyltransferase [Flavobacterium sp. CBA20B-1]